MLWNVWVSILRSDVYINSCSRTRGVSAECFQLAFMTLPSVVGDWVRDKVIQVEEWKHVNPWYLERHRICLHHHHHHWLDSPWWTLAFLRSFAQLSLSRAAFFHLLTPNIRVSWTTPFSHCNFGLPTLLVPSGLVLNIFLRILSLLIRVRCLAHDSFTVYYPHQPGRVYCESSIGAIYSVPSFVQRGQSMGSVVTVFLAMYYTHSLERRQIITPWNDAYKW